MSVPKASTGYPGVIAVSLHMLHMFEFLSAPVSSSMKWGKGEIDSPILVPFLSSLTKFLTQSNVKKKG